MQQIHIIESGEWQTRPHMIDYRAEWPGDMLVERATWAADAPPQQLYAHGSDAVVIGGPGYIWFRFWLSDEEQLVERYFDQEGQAIGSYIPICMPLQREERVYRTEHLLLSLWIDTEERMTVLHEEEFDAAVEIGVITPVKAEHAELQIRSLTTAVAQKRFPPALVRNFTVQMGSSQIQSDPPDAQERQRRDIFGNMGEY
jgi:hypothetical protein